MSRTQLRSSGSTDSKVSNGSPSLATLQGLRTATRPPFSYIVFGGSGIEASTPPSCRTVSDVNMSSLNEL